MKELALALGLSADATESQILSAIQSLTTRATAAETEMGELRTQIEQENQARIASLVDTAVLAGKIPAGKKEVFMTIGKTAGEKALSEAIASIGEPVKPSGVILNRGNATDQNPKSFTQYTAAELQAMRSDDMSSYVALFKAEYGHEPNI